ncbi:hypothetical protein NKCBBBOE_00919 [Pseudarthrobacter sp. MM222]|nr:hypothetical protein NKCBBBOE_00919 [Pseudarthrobacter sp. MM222]
MTQPANPAFGYPPACAEAIESITGRPVVETLIQMLALGKIYRIS